MPEGHTIHRLARDHGAWLAGQVLGVDSPQGRFADDAALLDGQALERVDAYGKHLLYRFGPTAVHVHLGLFGRFRRYTLPAPAPSDTVRMRLRGDDREVHLIGPTACELFDADAVEALCARLGPDPLRADADPERAWAKLQRIRRPIAAALMDQSVIAGIGNVYRAELLFLTGVWPYLPSKDLPRHAFDDLWSRAVELLSLGVRVNRIITVPQAISGRPPSRTRKEDRLWVYGRRTCRRCHGPVLREALASRTLWACPTCQRLGQ